MSFPDFLHRVAHSSPGGVVALEARMSKRDRVLQNKLNPNMESHHMTEDEIELMLDFIPDGNRQATEFFAVKADCLVIPMVIAGISNMELLDSFIAVVGKLGEFSTEFQRDWSDGKIDRKEFAQLRKDSREVMSSMAALLERIGQIVEPETKAAASE